MWGSAGVAGLADVGQDDAEVLVSLVLCGGGGRGEGVVVLLQEVGQLGLDACRVPCRRVEHAGVVPVLLQLLQTNKHSL